MLTSGQISHFETFGFLVLRQVLTANEVETIHRETDEIFDEARGGKPYSGKLEVIHPFFERRPLMASLVADDRIYSIGEGLLGPDFFLDVTEGWRHTGTTTWHGGGRFAERLPDIKISFYIEPLIRDTGCLRVVPGSHIRGEPDLLEPLRVVTDTAAQDSKPYGVPQSELPSVALESRPGDVVVFTESLLHASFGGSAGRYQHAMTYVQTPVQEKDIAQVRGSYERSKYSYRPCKSSINSDNPRIRKLVAPLVEWGFEAHDI